MTDRVVNNNVWIQTYTGKKFHPLSPRVEEICMRDMAHALSMLCRFTGHSKYFYSVAQHSVLVSQHCPTQFALYGLIHDCSEAFLQDWSAPLKRSGAFENYRDYEYQLQSMIYSKYGLSNQEPKEVKETDLRLLATEANYLMSPLHPDFSFSHLPLDIKIKPWIPEQAEELFLQRFQQLVSEDQYQKWMAE